MEQEILDIPKIEDPEIREAVKALTSVSDFLRSILIAALDGADRMELMQKHNEMLRLSDQIINKWLEEFEGEDDILGFINDN